MTRFYVQKLSLCFCFHSHCAAVITTVMALNLTPQQQFWIWLRDEAEDLQKRRQAFGMGTAGLATGGLAVLGTAMLPGVGTLVGAAIGAIFGSVVAFQTHQDKTFDRMLSLTPDEMNALVSAILRAFGNLTYALACHCVQDGTVAHLLDQIENHRRRRA